jgi:hypothetical protein
MQSRLIESGDMEIMSASSEQRLVRAVFRATQTGKPGA